MSTSIAVHPPIAASSNSVGVKSPSSPVPNDTLPPRWLTAAKRPGPMRSTVTCRVSPSAQPATLCGFVRQASAGACAVVQRVTEAVVTVASSGRSTSRETRRGDRTWALRARRGDPRRHRGGRRVDRPQGVEPARVRRRRRRDEPLGERSSAPRSSSSASSRCTATARPAAVRVGSPPLVRNTPSRSSSTSSTRLAASAPRWRPGGSAPTMRVSLVNDGPVTVLLESTSTTSPPDR